MAGQIVTVRRLLPWALPLLAVLVCLLWVFAAYVRTPLGDPIFIDWTTYALGTERALSGQSLYLPLQLTGPYLLPVITPNGYIYPPSSALLFAPFAVGPEIGLVAWLIANLGLLLAGLMAVLKRELGAVRPVPLALVLLGLITVIPLPEGIMIPFTNAVLTANVNIGLAGLLALTWAAGSRRGWIPYAAAIGATFKMFPAVLALWAARQDGWRALAIAAGAAAIVILITLPILGLEEWRSFMTALSNAEPTCGGGRTSIACLVLPTVGVSLAKLIGLAVSAVLLVAAIVVRREFPAFVLLTLGMLAPLADGHQHYLLFAYVLVVIGACRLLRRRGQATPTVAGHPPAQTYAAPSQSE